MLWAFTTIQVVHVVAISLFIASIAIVDLRLLGLRFIRHPVTELTTILLPWTWTATWTAFVIAALTGSLIFISQAVAYFLNVTFWLKMSLMVAAGINMLIFEFFTARGVENWDRFTTLPLAAKLAGGISISCMILQNVVTDM